MCGICGEFNFCNKNIDPVNIKRMADSLSHRGPDDWGIYCDGFIGLGHRRLSIIDLSAKGKQPMWSNDKSLCITFNGEVYNYQEIKKELLDEGYYFLSNTDTEVVVNAVHFWGFEKALSKFIGMFAFAIWDSNEKILFLCRDRVGIKPLYYYVTNKALLSPGHYLTVNSSGALKLHKYWGLETIERNSFQGSFEDAAEQLEQLLENAFAYRLVSDVPVGLFLSGGIDSSLVSAILKKKINADILNITIGFHDKNYDESPNAKKVSEELDVNHIVHYVDVSEAQDTLLKFPDIYDEPFGDTSGIPTYILSKIAREHVKVALSADGGDEQFCGYESYANYSLLKKFPWAVRSIASKFLETAIPYKRFLSWGLNRTNEALYCPQFIARYEKMLRLLKIRNIEDLIRLMNEKAWSQETIGEFLPVVKENLFKDTVLSVSYLHDYKDGIMDAMMRTDYSLFLRDDILAKVDRASMSASLECRDPMLDHRIAEFAFSLPIDYLFDQGEHKRILKKMLRKWVSEPIISSPKRGFMIPLYYWLRGVWKPIVLEYLSRENVKSVGLLDEKKVENEVNQFYKYNGCRAEKIWMMLNFQMWVERWYQ
jgi:asparagine synthase (glutamine-hydrolysing)